MKNLTYSSAEKNLISNGYIMEFGNPLKGVRFTDGKNYAIVLRMGGSNYEILYYKS
jgi:hypothetical protein